MFEGESRSADWATNADIAVPEPVTINADKAVAEKLTATKRPGEWVKTESETVALAPNQRPAAPAWEVPEAASVPEPEELPDSAIEPIEEKKAA